MERLNGMHRGDLDVNDDFTLTGMVTGDLIVLAGVVEVRGKVSGVVRAQGGVTRIRGAVGGVVGDDTLVRVAVGAHVAGKVLGPDLRWHEPTGATSVSGTDETFPVSQVGRPS